MSDDQENPWKRPNPRIPPPSGEPYKRRSEPKGDDVPAPFTPDWHAKRAEIWAEIARKQRAHRIVWTEQQRNTALLATELSMTEPGMIGHTEAMQAYQRDAAVQFGHWSSQDPADIVAKWIATLQKG